MDYTLKHACLSFGSPTYNPNFNPFFQRTSKSHRVNRDIINCGYNFSAFTKSNYQDFFLL